MEQKEQKIRTLEMQPIGEEEYGTKKHPFGHLTFIFIEDEIYYTVESFCEAIGNNNTSATCRKVEEYCVKVPVLKNVGVRPKLFITKEGMIKKMKNNPWTKKSDRSTKFLEFLEESA